MLSNDIENNQLTRDEMLPLLGKAVTFGHVLKFPFFQFRLLKDSDTLAKLTFEQVSL